MSNSSELSPEFLLDNAVWMRRLARTLVRDASRADDIVQQTLLAAVEHGRSGSEASRGWLGTVLRNLVRRSHREDQRRAQREHAVARRDVSWSAPEKLAERVELQRQIASMVLELGEPYRSAIILRYFHGLSPRRIAQEEGVAVTTVRSRLSRALAKLRRRLDGQYDGDRQAWRAVLLPLAFPWALGSTANGVAAATGVSGGGGTAVNTAITLGAIIMTQKTMILAGMASLLVLIAGLGLWMVSGLDEASPPNQLTAKETPEYLSLRATFERVASNLEETRRERDRLASLTRQLEDKLASLESESGVAAGPESEGAGLTAASSASTINWSEFSTLVAENLDLLARRYGDLTDEEKAALGLLRGELMKISAKAKTLWKAPLFNEQIFSGLALALFEGSLELEPEQSKAIAELARSITEGLPEDLGELTALDKYDLRNLMAGDLWLGVEEILTAEQLERWVPIRDYSEELFRYGARLEVGVNIGPETFLNNWFGNSLSVPPASLPRGEMKPFAAAYAEESKALLERYGRTNDDLRSLSTADRVRLKQEMLELQERFQERVLPFLNEEQRTELLTREPVIVDFRFGRSIGMSGRHSHF